MTKFKEVMLKIWEFMKKFWYVFALLIAGLAAVLLFWRKGSFSAIFARLVAISDKRTEDTRQTLADDAAARAKNDAELKNNLANIKNQHDAAEAKLNADTKTEADELDDKSADELARIAAAKLGFTVVKIDPEKK
jgi:hypothetical protein